MTAGMIGYLLGGFALSALFAAVWLLIAKMVPPLKRNPKLSYVIAMIVGFVPMLLISVIEFNPLNLLPPIVCAALIWWRYSAMIKRQSPGNA